MQWLLSQFFHRFELFQATVLCPCLSLFPLLFCKCCLTSSITFSPQLVSSLYILPPSVFLLLFLILQMFSQGYICFKGSSQVLCSVPSFPANPAVAAKMLLPRTFHGWSRASHSTSPPPPPTPPTPAEIERGRVWCSQPHAVVLECESPPLFFLPFFNFQVFAILCSYLCLVLVLLVPIRVHIYIFFIALIIQHFPFIPLLNIALRGKMIY